jgi:hypothetical protein
MSQNKKSNTPILENSLFKINSPNTFPSGTKCLVKGCPKRFTGRKIDESFKKHLKYYSYKGDSNKEDANAVQHLKLWKEWKKSLCKFIIKNKNKIY